MRQKYYRWLIVIIAVWDAMCIPTVSLPLMRAQQDGIDIPVAAFLLPIGFILLPISAYGLWNMHLWGLLVLIVATVIVFVSYPNGALLHVILAGAAVLQYTIRKSDSTA